MWENETEQSQSESSKTKTTLPPFSLPKSDEKDGLIIIQSIICIIIIIFVLLARALSMPFFLELKKQYNEIMKTGIDLSEQGELVRFVSGFVSNIRKQAQDILNSLDGEKGACGGAEKGTAISFPYSQSPYRLSVTPLMPVNGTVSSGFGKRTNPITQEEEFHSGTDLAAAKGSRVFASYSGTVEKKGFDNIRGNYIILRHTDNLKTLYQHLDKIYPSLNDEVLRGQIIGLVGKTGLATGYHLHYEIITENFSVDSEKALRLKAER